MQQEREGSGNVPVGWGHPDDEAWLSRRGNVRNVVVGIAIFLALVLLIVTLILLAITLSQYSSPACLATESYYIEILDNNAVYNDSFRPGAAGYNTIASNYEQALEMFAKDAGYMTYKIQVNYFQAGSAPKSMLLKLAAESAGVLIYTTITLEANENNFPATDKLQNDLQKQSVGKGNWSFITTDTNPANVCPTNPVVVSTTAVATSPATGTSPIGTTGATGSYQPTDTTLCPTPPPCPTDYPTLETHTPDRPTISHSTTVTPGNNIMADIMFILDESDALESGSWAQSWDQMKQFMISVANQYDIGQDKTRIAIVGYAGTASVQVSFTDSNDNKHLVDKINSLELLSTRTSDSSRNATEGFIAAYNEFFNTLRNAPRLALYVATYASSDDENRTRDRAVDLRKLSVDLYLVPITGYAWNATFQKEITDIKQAYGSKKVHVYDTFEGYGNLSTSSLSDDLKENARIGSTKQRCVADIALLVDESTTITRPTFDNYIKPFLDALATSYDISPDGFHFALIKINYPNTTGIEFDFKSEQTPTELIKRIDGLNYVGGSSSIERALNVTYDLFTPKYGARDLIPAAKNFSRIVIIVTDGLATDNTSYLNTAIQKLIDGRNAIILAVGIGSSLAPKQLKMLTGRDDMENVFSVDYPDELKDSVDEIVQKTNCQQQPTICQFSQLDIAFVVEDTDLGGETETDINNIKQFLNRIVGQFLVGLDDVRVALQLYNNQSKTVFDLDKYGSTSDVQNAINNAVFVHGLSANIGSALQYAYNTLITTGTGDRSCAPDIVIVLSYSKTTDDDANIARSAALRLRNAGLLVLAVGIGPNQDHGLLNDISGNLILGSPTRYYNVPAFQDLVNAQGQKDADDVATATCNYFPSALYPCEPQDIAADIVFVVDTSNMFSPSMADDTITFIERYLSPYVFDDTNVRAALVTYSDSATVDIQLYNSGNYSTFTKSVASVLSNPTRGAGRNIADALRITANQVLSVAGGYRPSVKHLVIVLTAGCFTGPDALVYANEIRNKPGQIYVVTLDTIFGSYKQLLDVAGNGQHVVQMKGPYRRMELTDFLPGIAWLWLCPDNCDYATTTTCPPCGSTTTESTTPTTSTEITTTSETTKTTSTATSTETTSTSTSTTSPTTTMETTSTTPTTTSETTTTTPTTTTETTTSSETTTTSPTSTTETSTTSSSSSSESTTTPSTTSESTTTPSTTSESTTSESTSTASTTTESTTTPSTTSESTTTASTTTESTSTASTTSESTSTASTTTESTTTPSTTSESTSTASTTSESTTTPSTTSESTSTASTTTESTTSESTTTPSTTSESTSTASTTSESTSTTPTTTTETSTTTTTQPPPKRCPGDVALLLDASSSVTEINFNNSVKPFMANISLGLQISPSSTHTGLVVFADRDKTSQKVDLTHGQVSNFVYNTIMDLNYNDFAGDTALYTALSLTYYTLFSTTNGARVQQWDNNVAAYVIIVTDGIASDADPDQLTQLAFTMLQNKITIYAVGVGSLVTQAYLKSLTYDDTRIYYAANYTVLDTLVGQILNATTCPLNTPKPSPPPPPRYCDVLDIVFVLDESESVNQQDPTNFDTLKQFMLNLTDMLTISGADSRVAAIGYGRNAVTHFHLYDSPNKFDLRSQIQGMAYLGGARNSTGGFTAALEEIQSYSRIAYDVPLYLIHVAEYAHDVGGDPIPQVKSIGALNVPVFNILIESFQDDKIFRTEMEDIVAAGGPDSELFNSTNYHTIWSESGIQQKFHDILEQRFLCQSTTSAKPQQFFKRKDEE